MEKWIQLYEHTMDIENRELSLIAMQLNNPMFMEDGDQITDSPKGEKKKGLLRRIIDKIIYVLNKAKSAIQNFFSSNKFKKMDDEVNAALANDPTAKNRKMNLPDYKKLDKLTKDTLNEIDRSDDPNAVVEKYQKQRNLLLGATVAITAGAAWLFHKNRKQESAVDDALDKSKRWQNELARIEVDKGKDTKASLKEQRNYLAKGAKALEEKVNAYQKVVNLLTTKDVTTDFSTLVDIHNTIVGKMEKSLKDTEADANKITGTDEDSVARRDKLQSKVATMRREVNNAKKLGNMSASATSNKTTTDKKPKVGFFSKKK